MPQSDQIVYPYHEYNFKVVIQEVVEAHFTEIRGLGASIQVIKYREAGNQQITRHIPGRVDYQPVTLFYGLTQSKELFDWMLACAAGRVSRRNVSIIMLDAEGVREATRWNLIGTWPAQWQGARLDAMGQEIAISSLTLVYDSLEQA